jgi:CMP/dCMP kinase
MTNERKIIIAIDGHSSCGKSTMAKALAAKTGYVYVDSGAMYRAVSYYCLREGLLKNGVLDEPLLKEQLTNIRIHFRPNENGGTDTYLNEENVEGQIRTLAVANEASKISTLRFVREEMVRQQQEMGKQKGIVMDGRDIGTVVFPKAELKIFVTASAEVRAERRYLELSKKGEIIAFDDVLANVKERDERDQNRTESPLKKAEDALVLDNSFLTPAEQMSWLFVQYERVIEQNNKI